MTVFGQPNPTNGGPPTERTVGRDKLNSGNMEASTPPYCAAEQGLVRKHNPAVILARTSFHY